MNLDSLDKAQAGLYKISFEQWQYYTQWGPTKVWLLLIESVSQYPVMTTYVKDCRLHNFLDLRYILRTVADFKNI